MQNNLHFFALNILQHRWLLRLSSLESILYFRRPCHHVVGLRPRCWCAALASADSGECNDPGHSLLTHTLHSYLKYFLSLVTGHGLPWSHSPSWGSAWSWGGWTRSTWSVTTLVRSWDQCWPAVMLGAEHSLVLAAQDWKLSSLETV